MKIAFITEHFNPERGGAEIYMAGLSHYLIENGCEVHFISQDSFEEKENLHCHLIKIPSFIKKIRWWQWRVFVKKALAEAQASQADIIIGTGKCIGANIYQPHGGVVHASQKQNIRLVKSPLMRSLKKISNLFSNKHRTALAIQDAQFANPDCHFVAISQMVYRDIQHYYNIPDERISLLYNGVDLKRFSPVSETEKDKARREFDLDPQIPAFAIVAHNFALKGVREIIEAVAKIQKNGKKCTVIVAGGGKQRKFVELAHSLGVSDSIRFVGSLSQPEKLYAAVDAYLQPTWYDPCSLVVLEAMSAGLPVLTTAFNGAGELVENGVHGYVISAPDAINELAESMNNLCDRATCRQLGQAAREKVQQHTLEANYAAMHTILRNKAKA